VFITRRTDRRLLGRQDAITMGRYERRQFFESLIEMRDRYADRPDDDLPGKPLLIGDAMRYAAAIMGALQADAAELGDAASAEAAEAEANAAEA
jgi:hypothetical protein